MRWNQFTLGTLLFSVFVVSILLAINVRFVLNSPMIRQGVIYDYSYGWPAPRRYGPAPRPPTVLPDGSVWHHAQGYRHFFPSARFVNPLIAVVVVVLSCLGFKLLRFVLPTRHGR